jgi:hypothetical protein
MRYEIKRNKSGYGYVEVGAVDFFAPQHRIWINNKLIQKDEDGEFVELTGRGKELVITEKGNFVLRPNPQMNTFVIGRKCGYRGNSWYKIKKGDVKIELPFEEYESERGSLGISTYAVVSTPDDEIFVDEFADGRLYGDDEVYHKKYFIDKNGKDKSEIVPDCIDDKDLCAYLE